MKSEAFLRERLREIIVKLLPRLDADGHWPHLRDYELDQAKHWFYCLTEVLELDRKGHERLDHWMYRIAKELGPPGVT